MSSYQPLTPACIDKCTGVTFSSFRDLYDCLFGEVFRKEAVMRNLWEQETMTARSIRQTEQVNSNTGKRDKKEVVMTPRESHYRQLQFNQRK